MCWESDTKKKHIAKEKIPIFKIGYLRDNKIYSLYYDFIYELNKQYNVNSIECDTIINIFQSCIYSIKNGFHSYDIDCTININFQDIYGCFRPILNIKNKDIILDTVYNDTIEDLIKINGYIPKGSIYFINKNKEIASNSIVLTDYSKIMI